MPMPYDFPIVNTQLLIMSDTVTFRIGELESLETAGSLSADQTAELAALTDFQEQGFRLIEDWDFRVALLHADSLTATARPSDCVTLLLSGVEYLYAELHTGR